MWSKNVEHYLKEFDHTVNFTDYIDQTKLKEDSELDVKIKNLIWLMKNHEKEKNIDIKIKKDSCIKGRYCLTYKIEVNVESPEKFKYEATVFFDNGVDLSP